jgi:hypothetical protein
MYQNCSKKVNLAIETLFKHFHGKLGAGYEEFRNQISAEFRTILDQNSTNGSRPASNRKVNSAFKQKVNDTLTPDFDWLAKAWSLAPDEELPEKDQARSYGCDVEELLATVFECGDKPEKDDGNWSSEDGSEYDEH